MTSRRTFLGALVGAGAIGTTTLARASEASPDTLILPPGTAGPLTLSLTRPICIRGAGVGVTTVPNIDIAANGHHVTLSDLSVSNGSVRITNPTFAHAYLERVNVKRWSQPGVGVHLKNVIGASLRDCWVFGGDVGFWIEGDPFAAFGGSQRTLITRIDGCHTDRAKTGFRFTGNGEGIYTSCCEAIGCQYGYDVRPGVHAPGTIFMGCHAAFTHAGFQLEQVTGVKVIGAILFRFEDRPLAVGVRLHRTQYCHVTDSTIHNLGGGAAFFGVLADGADGFDHQITGNTIHGATFAGVGIIDGTKDCRVVGNQFRYTGTPYFERASSGNVWEPTVVR